MTETTDPRSASLDLDAIEARHVAARAGEWKVTETQADCPVVYVDHESISGAVTVLFEADWGELADAEFIAHSHQDVPALTAEVWLLRRKLTLLFLAAEAVESEADGENRSSRALADMRRIMNAIPTGALNDAPAAELVEQDEAVKP
jgi:hypothetical protein